MDTLIQSTLTSKISLTYKIIIMNPNHRIRFKRKNSKITPNMNTYIK